MPAFHFAPGSWVRGASSWEESSWACCFLCSVGWNSTAVIFCPSQCTSQILTGYTGWVVHCHLNRWLSHWKVALFLTGGHSYEYRSASAAAALERWAAGTENWLSKCGSSGTWAVLHGLDAWLSDKCIQNQRHQLAPLQIQNSLTDSYKCHRSRRVCVNYAKGNFSVSHTAKSLSSLLFWLGAYKFTVCCSLSRDCNICRMQFRFKPKSMWSNCQDSFSSGAHFHVARFWAACESAVLYIF